MAGARGWNSIVGAGEVARVLLFKRPRVLLLKALSIRVRGGSLTIRSATTRRGGPSELLTVIVPRTSLLMQHSR